MSQTNHTTGKANIPLVQVNIGLFAHKVGVTTTDTLDLSQGIHDLALAINVGVEETQDVLYFKSTFCHTTRIFSDIRTWNCWWASGTTRDMVGDGGVT